MLDFLKAVAYGLGTAIVVTVSATIVGWFIVVWWELVQNWKVAQGAGVLGIIVGVAVFLSALIDPP